MRDSNFLVGWAGEDIKAGAAVVIDPKTGLIVNAKMALCEAKDAAWPDTPACQLQRGHPGPHQASEDGKFYGWPSPPVGTAEDT